MSLYGALFSGVSGLSAQSSDLSIIADNISNVNTVGYKGGDALFQTLVTGASSNTSYSPGGVIGGNQQTINQQGLLQSTSSQTDIAIQGGGLFVVNSEASGTGQVLYTRAGSFTPDATGNFKNSAGFYLQAWPLNNSGQLPGAPGNTDITSSANLSSLKTVNVQSLAGSAEATSTVSLSANLDAGATAYPGASAIAAMDNQNPANFGIGANDIIVPGTVPSNGADALTPGDTFSVTTGTVSDSYVYGGFTTSRDVTTGAGGDSGASVMATQAPVGASDQLDANDVLTALTTLGTSAFSTTNGHGVVTITAPANGLNTGDTVTIAGIGAAGVGGIPQADLNGTFTVTVIDPDHYQITAKSGAMATSTTTGGNNGATSTIVPFATDGADGAITVTAPNNGLTTGDTVTIAGQSADIGGITSGQINGTFSVVVIDANHYRITTGGTSGTPATGGTAGVNTTIDPFKTTSGNGVVTVTAPHTTLAAGDYVTISGVTTGAGGITANKLNGTFKVVSVLPDGNHYTIDTSGAGNGASGGVGTSGISAAGLPFSVASSGSNTVTVYQPDNGLVTGDVVTLSGNTGTVGGIAANDLNGSFVVNVVDANHYTITTTGIPSTSAGGGGAGTITDTMRPFAGKILDAGTATQAFLGVTGTSGFTTAALSFTITTAAAGTVTFTYTSASPNAQLGQFNDLDNLATAINNVTGLSARVVDNQLYVGATDASNAVTFANGSTTGISGPPVQAGIDWVRELGVANIASTTTNRYSTLQGLADLVNASPGLTATVSNPLAAASLAITDNSPLDTMTLSDRAIVAPLPAFMNTGLFTTTVGSKVVTLSSPATFTPPLVDGDVIHLDGSGMTGPVNGIPQADFSGDFTVSNVSGNTFTITVAEPAITGGPADGTGSGLLVTPPNNTGSPLAELGLVASLDGKGLPSKTPTTGALGPAYAANDPTKNMAGGAITPQFSRPITVYDALGAAHNLNVGFIKTGSNTWAVEVYSQPSTDVTVPNGQVAAGTVSFNGDGSLLSVSNGLSHAINIDWTDGAAASTVTFNWGTAGQPFGTPNATVIGKTDGLSQFDSAYAVNFANQNGAPVGSLTGVSIDANGFIIANYSNGQTQKLYQIPLASFTAADQLQAVSGNVYQQTSASGQESLTQAGTNGVGTISSQSLESSNVDLATQLTSMIVAQSAYQANTKVISTANTLLTDLDQILQ